MEKTIYNFINEFKKIRELGYVKAINNDSSGIGLTFEKLLGKEVDNFSLPDFENLIEIKTKLAFSTKPIHLFKLSPEGNTFFETKRLLLKYGNYHNKNVSLNVSLLANQMKLIGLTYYFLIKVDYKEKKVKLLIYNKNKRLIDSITYWSFRNLESTLLRKLKYLALIEVWSTQRLGIKYYKYFRYSIFKYSNIYNFLNLLEIGVIGVTFSIDAYILENNNYKIHDHGTSFDIKKENLEKLFYRLY